MKKHLIIPIALLALCAVACEKNGQTLSEDSIFIKSYYPTKVLEGQEVSITGNGLDRVKAVIFPGKEGVTDFESVNSSMLKVSTPAGVESGELCLETTDGSIIKAATALSVGLPEVSVLSPSGEITAGDELSIFGKDLEFTREIIFPGSSEPLKVDALDFKRKAEDRVIVKVPVGVAEGETTLELLLCSGEKITTPAISLKDKPTGEWVNVEKTAWSGSFDLNGWANNLYILASWFPGIQPGSKLTFYFEQYGGWGQFKLNLGDWGKYNFPEVPDSSDGGQMVTTDVLGGYDVTQFSITITDNLYDPWFVSPPNKDRALIINGERIKFTKITYTVDEWHSFDEPDEPQGDDVTVLWEGSAGPIDWTDNVLGNKITLDNQALSLLEPGKIIGIDFDCSGDGSSGYNVRIMGGWWTVLPSAIADYNNEWETHAFDASETNYELTLTQEDIDILVQQQSILFCGAGIVIKRLYLK